MFYYLFLIVPNYIFNIKISGMNPNSKTQLSSEFPELYLRNRIYFAILDSILHRLDLQSFKNLQLQID